MESISDDEDLQEEEISGKEQCCPCIGELCSAKKERRGLCYYCFLFVLMGFSIIFPLFLVWLVESPMP
eukprot:12886540-Prorocentrum_lima.AAC.1